MGYREFDLKLPTDYADENLRAAISRRAKTRAFTFRIVRKSLDARDTRRIVWQIRVGVSSDRFRGASEVPAAPALEIPGRFRREKVLVVGNGPAGFFAAFVLRKAGFDVTIIDRGAEVEKRAAGIGRFETSGVFDPVCNYAFGEGGAGTFSDGKLTSRSKHIGIERRFILSSYVEAGGPEEIGYLAHPHLGSDNLKSIVKNLRDRFLEAGGKILFETVLLDLTVGGGVVRSAVTDSGTQDADIFILAPGHSAYETYRMLMRRGVGFATKSFALGSRIEHPQALINRAQWGVEQLPGVKAAEYRLTSPGEGSRGVYTFCMCPGGTVVPAAMYEDINVVNGMSDYLRDSPYANAACVAGVSLPELTGHEVSAAETLDWVEALERRFKQETGSFRAPACTMRSFITGNGGGSLPASSYPLGLEPAPLWEMLPEKVVSALRAGLRDFAGKLEGFDTGIMLGLESKTSAPIQAVRDAAGRCAGFANLYIAGEGSGYAGGIVSSGADGIRTAMGIARA